MKKALIFWFTGLSGSGKTTIAKGVERFLAADGYSVSVLDGDEVRSRLHGHLGFTEQDIRENNLLIADLCENDQHKYDIIVVSIISPYASCRLLVRKMFGNNFFEIYFAADLLTVVKRDTKGLYSKAQNKKITNLIGFSPGMVYEPPQYPDYIVDSKNETVEESLSNFHKFVIKQLNNRVNT